MKTFIAGVFAAAVAVPALIAIGPAHAVKRLTRHFPPATSHRKDAPRHVKVTTSCHRQRQILDGA